MWWILVLVACVALTVVVVVVVLSWRPRELGLQAGRLRTCPSSPNCVNTQDPDPARRAEPLAVRGPPDAALDALVAMLEAHPRVHAVRRDGDYVHAEFRTAILRFADDVEFLLDRDVPCIHVRSASRVGHSDLGANAARLASLRHAWADRE